jgi:hypothetical protein
VVQKYKKPAPVKLGAGFLFLYLLHLFSEELKNIFYQWYCQKLYENRGTI